MRHAGVSLLYTLGSASDVVTGRCLSGDRSSFPLLSRSDIRVREAASVTRIRVSGASEPATTVRLGNHRGADTKTTPGSALSVSRRSHCPHIGGADPAEVGPEERRPVPGSLPLRADDESVHAGRCRLRACQRAQPARFSEQA